ncbi:glyoxylate/hydroxypyruvate reductase A [uncultured Eudoraea sp.]|uniref:2-hydroxyacid dehydrogenase n=1 Tax=uncultured Eudoraea sp. TaxID=1035614 RepID=UPI002635BF94|nr:glyoxylate/hydroxypyruvate reductase A [uncultured Eudoraea sp.]
MAIVVIRQDNKLDMWKNALIANAPDTSIYTYLEEHPKKDITMACVWKQPAESLNLYPNLRCIASFGAGVDFIFKDQSVPEHIPITRVVDPVLASDMSEFVLASILGFFKNLNSYKTDQLNKIWAPREYKRISDVTVGIMGMGALGEKLAEDLIKNRFKVVGWANSPKVIPGVDIYSGNNQKNTFLSQSNILVCLLPLTKETTGILNNELFKELPKQSYVINVARGGHLVDEDLLEYLNNGHLAGAGLDVFHQEPLPVEHPFWNHPKIHITPHVASVSDIDSVIPQLLENYRRLKEGLPLMNEVSREKGY